MMQLLERMVGVPDGTYTGHPKPIGEIVDGNAVIAQELGSNPEGPDLQSNVDIAEYILADQKLYSLPIFASASIAKILRRRREELGIDLNIVHEFTGPSADNHGENTGTYGELRQYLDYLKRPGVEPGQYSKPIFVSSGYNAGNIYRQAQLLKIQGGIVPDNLPRSFDRASKQFWTQHRLFWMLTSYERIRRLKREKH